MHLNDIMSHDTVQDNEYVSKKGVQRHNHNLQMHVTMHVRVL